MQVFQFSVEAGSFFLLVCLGIFFLIKAYNLLKKNQKKERNLESFFQEERSIVANMVIPVWMRNEKGVLIFCNKAYGDLLEMLPKEALEKNCLLWEPSLKPRFPLKKSLIVKGDRRVFEFFEKEVEGGLLVGWGKDETPFEDVRRDLNRHIDSYREVLETLSAGIMIFGPDRRVKFFNHAYTRLFGVNEEWLHAEPTLNELLDDLRDRRLLEEQADFPSFKRKENEAFQSLTSVCQQLIHLPDGRSIRKIVSPHPLGGVFYIFEDVTNILVFERQYNTQVAVRKETLDNLYEGIAVFGSDNQLHFTNPAFRHLWRWTPQERGGNQHISFLLDSIEPLMSYGGDWKSYKEYLIHRVTDRVPKKKRVQLKDGCVLDFSYVPLPDGSHLMSSIDVTDSFHVEQILREKNEALAAADQLKSEFIANVSYELRSPLSAIIGFTEILTHEYLGNLNVSQAEYCHHILESSQQLLSLVNDILDVATLEAGYLNLEHQELDLYKVLASVCALVRPRAKQKKQDLRLRCDKDIGTLMGDENRLKQAFFNLLSNALKFTPEEGRIFVKVDKEESSFRIMVSDTGAGISSDEKERVFGKFEKGQGERRSVQGAGLGLSLVKGLIELHGGTVFLSSEEGKGTVVTCVLPFKGGALRDVA